MGNAHVYHLNRLLTEIIPFLEHLGGHLSLQPDMLGPDRGCYRTKHFKLIVEYHYFRPRILHFYKTL